MDAHKISQKLQTLSLDGNLNIREIRDDISAAKEHATTEKEHVHLLELFKIVMDCTERQLEEKAIPDDLASFRKIRDQDYCRLLILECLQGTNVNSELLEQVTRREVEGGRMSPDHNLRELATIGTTFGIGTTEQLRKIEEREQRGTLWQRITRRVKGRLRDEKSKP